MTVYLIANWNNTIVGFTGVSTNTLGYVIFKKQTSVNFCCRLMITLTYFSTALSKKEATNKIQQKLIIWTC